MLQREHVGEIATATLKSGRSVRAIVLEQGLVAPAELDDLLSPEAMTRPRSIPRADRTL